MVTIHWLVFMFTGFLFTTRFILLPYYYSHNLSSFELWKFGIFWQASSGLWQIIFPVDGLDKNLKIRRNFISSKTMVLMQIRGASQESLVEPLCHSKESVRENYCWFCNIAINRIKLRNGLKHSGTAKSSVRFQQGDFHRFPRRLQKHPQHRLLKNSYLPFQSAMAETSS